MARSNTGSTSNYLTYSKPVLTSYPCTLSCWFKAGSATVTSDLFGFPSSGSYYMYMIFDGGNSYGEGAGAIIADAGGGVAGAVGYTTTTITDVTKWHHCGATFASATNRIAYLDGLGGSVNASNCVLTTFTSTDVGIYLPTFGPLNGSVADVAIWNSVLAPSDMTSLAAGVSPLFIAPGSLLAYWPLLGTNSPEIDFIGGLPFIMTGQMGVVPGPQNIVNPYQIYANRNYWFLTEHSTGGTPAGLSPFYWPRYRRSLEPFE